MSFYEWNMNNLQQVVIFSLNYPFFVGVY